MKALSHHFLLISSQCGSGGHKPATLLILLPPTVLARHHYSALARHRRPRPSQSPNRETPSELPGHSAALQDLGPCDRMPYGAPAAHRFADRISLGDQLCGFGGIELLSVLTVDRADERAEAAAGRFEVTGGQIVLCGNEFCHQAALDPLR